MDRPETSGQFSVEKAHKTQLQMSEKIIFQDKLPEKIHLIAGVDAAYVDGFSIGAVALLDFDSLQLVEAQTAFCTTRFAYISSLFSFHETRPAVMCIRKLQREPNVILVDGHGFAHPFRCGLASHIGLVLRKPTIGVAKTKLVGEVETSPSDPRVRLLKKDHETIGAAVTTKNGCKPLYVSVGHMVSLGTAVKIVRACARNNRIPEPLRIAHKFATNEKSIFIR